jgi:hypothetical protein
MVFRYTSLRIEWQPRLFINLGSSNDAHPFGAEKQGLGWLEPKPCLFFYPYLVYYHGLGNSSFSVAGMKSL